MTRWKTWIRRNNSPAQNVKIPLSAIELTFYALGAVAVVASWTSAAITG